MTAATYEQTWTTMDRSSWGPGPWDGEPDKVSWTDPATGRPCLAVRNPVGAWCGYVAVDPGHPLHGQDYDVPDVVVHGGLTYAAYCREGATEAEGICHVPRPGQPHDVWWFGFDTCQAAFRVVRRRRAGGACVVTAAVVDHRPAYLDGRLIDVIDLASVALAISHPVTMDLFHPENSRRDLRRCVDKLIAAAS